ncbi:phosphomannomutase/phosphoglucomutase, partial [Candidatus Woesearchaeota archaeon]|nr:phosphomannomutase/phosphoglucomutase [Candidatus Woesearchaeota archaeon]
MEQQTIYKAYDIRGMYPTTINEDVAYKLGRVLVVFLKTKQILVGRDCRNGSKELATELLKGITDQGADAVDIGLCSTPMMNFASAKNDAVMVTASHLMPPANGFKIFKKGALPIGAENGLLEIKKLIEKNKFAEPKPSPNKVWRGTARVQKGELIRDDVMQDYVKHVLTFAKNIKPLKIVIDAGNGMAGYTSPYLFAQLPCNVTRLFFQLNGEFPARGPNPQATNALTQLSRTVVEQHADIGAAYDADADRLVLVDETGEIVSPDLLIVLLAQQLFGKKKDSVVYELTCSKAVPEAIVQLGGKPIISRVGHTFIQQILAKNKAIVGGERSGHYFFRDNYNGDSADIALAVILSLLSKTGKKISELVNPLKKYHALQTSVQADNKEEVLKALQETFTKGTLTKLDGITLTFPDWWFNARPSNTEPIVKLTIEARTKDILEQKNKEIQRVVQKF